MGKKRTFLKKKALAQDLPLQITSMADIFMILLVFLLKNYATSVTNLAPSGSISLPTAVARGQPGDTLKVEVASNVVLLDQKPVIRLNNYQFDASEGDADGPSVTLSRLMSDQRSMKPEPNADSTLVVMADQRTPYSTLKRIVASAAGAGFVDLQLVVVQEEE